MCVVCGLVQSTHSKVRSIGCVSELGQSEVAPRVVRTENRVNGTQGLCICWSAANAFTPVGRVPGGYTNSTYQVNYPGWLSSSLVLRSSKSRYDVPHLIFLY